jgi:antitoxin (DNA-binding transcriptional repressor) of toxin-antitoxin stability system
MKKVQMEQIVSVTNAIRNFSHLINRVYYQGQSYLLTRGGVVVARLTAPKKYLIGAQLAQRWPDKLSLSAEEAANWESELTELQITVGAPAEVVWDS